MGILEVVIIVVAVIVAASAVAGAANASSSGANSTPAPQESDPDNKQDAEKCFACWRTEEWWRKLSGFEKGLYWAWYVGNKAGCAIRGC
jgi:hypothetical protein